MCILFLYSFLFPLSCLLLYHTSFFLSTFLVYIHEYRWKNNNGKTILYVECRDGVVTDVTKYWEDKYWTADGKPIYSGTRSGYSSSSNGKKKVYNDDSYNVNDYYDAEDFYEDYYDDFYDYEDAEDYFDENRDW